MSGSSASASPRTAEDIAARFADLATDRQERCAFAFLDPEWRLLGVYESPAGHAGGAEVPLRAVIAEALRLHARAAVMVHNHPGGDSMPSAADIAATRRAIAALEAIDVRLVDHVVLAPSGHASMRAMGLL